MATKILYDGASSEVYIDENYTDGAVLELKRAINNRVINPDQIHQADIVYDCLKGIDFDTKSPSHYPLKFTGPGLTVYVTAVTAGYGGKGPLGTLKCLELMGFSLTEDEKNSILSKPRLENGDEDPFIVLNFKK